MKEKITDKEIIRLYKDGWSQKDIVAKYKCSVIRTRKVLQKNGFDTTAFRKVPETIVEAVKILLSSGMTAKEISKRLDLSIYSINSIISDKGLKGISKKARKNACAEKILALNGENKSACQIAKELDMDYKFVISVLKENGVYQSRNRVVNRTPEEVERIRLRVVSMYQDNYTISAIQEELNISYAYAKKFLKEAGLC